MTFLLKDPVATLDYAVDWGANYLKDDTLVSSDWAVSPVEAGGAVIVDNSFDPTVASAKVSGGIAGRVYRVTNHVLTVQGREDSRSVVLRVEKR